MDDLNMTEALRARVFSGFDSANACDTSQLDDSFKEIMTRTGVAEVSMESVLESIPKIVNFHFHCRIVRGSLVDGVIPDDRVTREVIFPLQDMQSEGAGLTYKFPSLWIKLDRGGKDSSRPPGRPLKKRVPSASLSKRGYLTLVGGGGTPAQFREYVFQACYMIFRALRCLCPSSSFTVDEFRMNNKVASAKAKGMFFLLRLHDDLRAHNFYAEMDNKIGFLYVKNVFPKEGLITFSISANGKMNIIGFRHDYQAIKALRILSPFFKRNLVDWNIKNTPVY